jgi:hypothetical protein
MLKDSTCHSSSLTLRESTKKSKRFILTLLMKKSRMTSSKNFGTNSQSVLDRAVTTLVGLSLGQAADRIGSSTLR